MRSFRQILHCCKKHHYRHIRNVRWYEDEYKDGMRSKWICMNCHHILYMQLAVGIKQYG